MQTSSHLTLKKKLTIRYLIALSLVACVMLFTFMTILKQIQLNDQDAYIINISGMQRMLSQRLALLAQEVYHAPSPEDAKPYIENMRTASSKMMKNHKKLVEIALEREASTPLEVKISSIYFNDAGVDEKITLYESLVSDFLGLYDAQGFNALRNAQIHREISSLSQGGLLEQLDSIVSLYEEGANLKIERFKVIETLFLSIGLFLLLLEALFIFRPTVNKVTETVEELERSNAELREFSYRISHDLRAPVVSSLGMIDLVSTAMQSGNTDMQEEAIPRIRGSLEQLKNLIEDIVNLTKMKMQDISKEAVSVNALVNDVQEKLKHMPGADEIDIRIDVEENLNVNVKKLMLQQTFDNLISNAIKYCDPEKDKRYVNVTVKTKNGKCFVSVRDNGLGIPEDYHDKIFGMFQRFHPRASFGSGLGLYLVMQNVMAIDGKMAYVPHEDGSEFKFDFPIE